MILSKFLSFFEIFEIASSKIFDFKNNFALN